MAKSTARTPSPKRKVGAEARPQNHIGRIVKVRFTKAVNANLGAIETLADFRSSAGKLSLQDRMTIVEQAQIIIEQVYVHLPLKRAMHGTDPVQRLRLVKQRLDTYSERAFHNEMTSIFVHLRDLHTNYILPEPYRGRVAFLPFHLEECFEGAGPAMKPLFLVTEVTGKLSDPDFKRGVVVTHWNGIPIAAAIDVNAEREAGSNLDARHLRGLESMTNRVMGMSLPPDEDWVDVRYLPDSGKGPAREARFAWQVFTLPPTPRGSRGSVAKNDRLVDGDAHLLRIGIDTRGEMERRVRKLLFAPKAVSAQQKMTDLGARAPAAAQAYYAVIMKMAAKAIAAQSIAPELGVPPRRQTAAATTATRQLDWPPRRGLSAKGSAAPAGAMLKGVDLNVTSIMPDVIKEFAKIPSPKGPFGYIRIATFNFENGIETFIREFVRIVALLPQEGLILDVRGNGGGYINAGELLLQTMTAGTIEPERFHLINTPLILQICEKERELALWKGSVRDAVETGSTFSQGFPLTSPASCNAIGQTYQGPVVLIVDAGCYSTTDIFAAGFQDHNIGRVLGTSGHTGAGGANVWQYTDLEQTLPPKSSPFKPIPGDASFSVAIRRSTRVGARAGEPLEDLGVVPDLAVYRLTRNDLLNHNADLIAHACGILAGMDRQRLAATCNKKADGSLAVSVVTSNVQRVDVLLNGRTIHTSDVKDGSTLFNVGVPGQPVGVLECKGFRDARLVASTRVKL
jgi:C-terminal processing protease CtpA/Prc